ncbi:MAG: peptide deformylase [Myxococcales bacterium]
MAVREIIIWPDPRLKEKCKPVGAVDAAVRKLCDDMAETMYESNGVGLAAPQIGVHQNVIAIDVEQKPKEGEPAKKKGEGLFWLIDPVIRGAEGEFTYTEGCLSIPDEYEEVTRYGSIVVDFLGRDGKQHRLEAENNLLTVCVQHEMDHLVGKLFVDHLSALKRELIKRRMKRLKAQRAAEKKGEATVL